MTEHLPVQAGSPRAVVVLYNAGQVGRVGPQSLYVRATEAWAEAGRRVLRMDLAGVGDAVADNASRHFDDHDPDEVAEVLDTVGREVPVFVAGLCAGARVALRAAARRDFVAGVATWGCSIVSSAPGALKSPYETAVTAQRAAAVMARQDPKGAVRGGRLLRADWWLTRLRNASREIPELLSMVADRFRRRTVAGNPLLAELDRLVDAGKPLLFLYGERDMPHFREFGKSYQSRLQPAAQSAHVIPSGNHTFSTHVSQDEAIRVTAEWFDVQLARR